MIYARLGMVEYGNLINKALGANVTAARANNLNAALPFLDWADVARATIDRLTAAAGGAPNTHAAATGATEPDLQTAVNAFGTLDLDAEVDPELDADAEVDG